MDNSNSLSATIQQNLDNPNLFVFPSAYGGAVRTNKPPQIHDMMRQLRIQIGAIEAKKSEDKYGPKFPVRGAKDLAIKLANALNSLNMEAPVVSQEVSLLPTDAIPQNERGSGNPVFRTLAHVKATVRLIAPDTSFIDLVGSGHGGDVDDKSGGKASTYAWKDALLKGLSIPHEDMVDTDDDSSTGGSESVGGGKTRATRGKKTSARDEAGEGDAGDAASVGASGQVSMEPSMDSGAKTSTNSQLKEALARIKAASSKDDLESVRADIKSGAIQLHGADRLNATKAFVERSKELS